MEFFTELSYVGLFVSAFLAATILPFSSEITLSALLLNGLPPGVLIFLATTGNVLGSLANYALGYWANLGLIEKILRVSRKEMDTAEKRFGKYGTISLLFAWVPVIGDPLTIIAGILRIRLLWFIILVTIGKLLRYMAVSYFVLLEPVG